MNTSSGQPVIEYTTGSGQTIVAHSLAEARAKAAGTSDPRILSSRVIGHRDAGAAHADADSQIERAATSREIYERRQRQAGGEHADAPVAGESVYQRRAREARAYRDGKAPSADAGARFGSEAHAAAVYRRRGTAS